MSSRGAVGRNALANVVQAIVAAGLLFALYRYVNSTLGVSLLGVWSVLLATASASRLADLGLSAGVTRFVARDLARGDGVRAASVIDTAAVSVMVLVGALAPLAYPWIVRLLPHLFEPRYVTEAQAILPYALASVWLTVVGAVFQSALDGCQRMALRAGLVVTGQVLLLALAVWLIPRRGLVGLAWAQLGQGLFLAVAGRLLLARVLPQVTGVPRRWDAGVLREILGYGANVQAAALFMLLLDPVAKALMARFGGAAAAGYFEIANQVVLKVRALIVAANQAIVPRVAELSESAPSTLLGLYRANMRLLVFVTVPTFALTFAWAGTISWLLLGSYQVRFVHLEGLLLLAWGINTLAVPAYFTNMGAGHVGWNTASHVVMGSVNAALGWILGNRFGWEGVAWTYCGALLAGSLLLLAVFHRKNRVACTTALASQDARLVLVSVAVAALAWRYPIWPGAPAVAVFSVGLFAPLVAIGAAAWYHPLRRDVQKRLRNRWAAR